MVRLSAGEKAAGEPAALPSIVFGFHVDLLCDGAVGEGDPGVGGGEGSVGVSYGGRPLNIDGVHMLGLPSRLVEGDRLDSLENVGQLRRNQD